MFAQAKQTIFVAKTTTIVSALYTVYSICQYHVLNKLRKILDSFDVLVDPWQQRGDACIDARILTLAAANAPGDDAHLGIAASLVHDHGTTRVTLCQRNEKCFQ